MSILVMSLVFKLPLPPTKKLVLLCLADFSNDFGENIFPSVGTLATKSSCAARTVQRVLKDLEKDEFITCISSKAGGAPGSTAHYQINLKKLNQEEGEKKTGDKLSPVKRGDKRDARGVTNTTERGDTVSPKPPINHQNSTTTNIKVVVEEEVNLLVDAALKTYRQSGKQIHSESAFKSSVRARISKFGPSAEDLLNLRTVQHQKNKFVPPEEKKEEKPRVLQGEKKGSDWVLQQIQTAKQMAPGSGRHTLTLKSERG